MPGLPKPSIHPAGESVLWFGTITSSFLGALCVLCGWSQVPFLGSHASIAGSRLPGQPWDGVIREELDRSDLVLKDKPGDCLSAQLRIRCGQTG
jgi:hypothetical protein